MHIIISPYMLIANKAVWHSSLARVLLQEGLHSCTIAVIVQLYHLETAHSSILQQVLRLVAEGAV